MKKLNCLVCWIRYYLINVYSKINEKDYNIFAKTPLANASPTILIEYFTKRGMDKYEKARNRSTEYKFMNWSNIIFIF